MPRGMNPNSLKALEEHRKKTQFKSGEKQVEVARAGGKANGITLKRRKTFREEFLEALQQEIEVNGKNGVEKKSVQEIGTRAVMKKYMNGDLRAMEMVRDTIGEKPVDVVMISEIDPEVMTEVEGLVNGL